ncbi:MAG: hypothetical protein IPJ39_21065 [Saprospiraceae bacterium]|nr:hypothetical protein [Saprospiraceae bacterium]
MKQKSATALMLTFIFILSRDNYFSKDVRFTILPISVPYISYLLSIHSKCTPSGTRDHALTLPYSIKLLNVLGTWKLSSVFYDNCQSCCKE